MKFAFLMTADYAQWRGMSPEQSQALESQVRAFNDQLGDAGSWSPPKAWKRRLATSTSTPATTRISRTAQLPRSPSELPRSGSSMWPIWTRRLAGRDRLP